MPTDPIPYLEVDEESLLFHNGCNGVGASSRLKDGQFDIELVFMRGIGCAPRFDAAEALLNAVADSIAGWSAYSLQGDELTIQFPEGEIRFSRAIPPNPAGLRAFPLRRPSDAAPTYDDSEGLLRGPILLEDGCLRIGNTNNLYSSYLIIWPPPYAVAFDDETAWATWGGEINIRIGDDVVTSGGRLLAIEPLLDAAVLRLGSIPDDCPGPYWVVEDVQVLATATLEPTPEPTATATAIATIAPSPQPTITPTATPLPTAEPLPAGWLSLPPGKPGDERLRRDAVRGRAAAEGTVAMRGHLANDPRK